MSISQYNLSAQFRCATSCLKEDSEAVAELLPDIDWSEFVAFIHRHRIGPIVFRKILKLEISIPDDVAAQLKRAYQKNVIRTLQHTAVARRIDACFSEENIEYMLLKGFSNRTGYDQLADRQVNDLDILVRREEDIWAAVNALKTRGMAIENWDPDYWGVKHKDDYLRRKQHIELIDTRYNVRVELHFRLFAYMGARRLDTATLWSTRKLMNLASTELAVLNKNKQLEYLVAHGCGCGWFRLKWIADIYFILGKKSDEELIGLLDAAKDDGWLRSYLLSLSVLSAIFHMQLPIAICRAIDTDRGVRSMTDVVYRNLHELPPGDRADQPVIVRGEALVRRLRYELKLHRSLESKWRMLLNLGFSPANWAAVPLPDSLFFLYAWLNPFIHLLRVIKSR